MCTVCLKELVSRAQACTDAIGNCMGIIAYLQQAQGGFYRLGLPRVVCQPEITKFGPQVTKK